MQACLQETSYWIDQEDAIIRVCSDWDGFALDNDGESAASMHVVGKPLWDFVAGDVTKMWVSALLMLARSRADPVERPYRCDSPTQRRYMSMHIIPEDAGVLQLKHCLNQTEDCAPPVYCRPATKYTSTFRSRCSICGHVQQDNTWVEPGRCDAFNAADGGELTVIYRVCESCMRLLPS